MAETASEWAKSLSPGDCELIIHEALAAGDMKAVVFALRLLAVKDPRRAQTQLDLIQFALDLAKAGPGTVEAELRDIFKERHRER